ncbi:MAG TPA: FIST N-terminal domain-containing protein [Gaiellales bacterium]|nr:FIST N-terminal domain-containing protein [Gaiellales bacterium]
MTVRCAVEVASSVAADARASAAEAAAAARAGLGGPRADLAFVFVSAEHAGDAAEVAAEVRRELDPGVLAGASTEAVIGGGREFEGRPAVSVLAASLGSGTARARHVSAADDGDLELAGPAVIVADPYTYPVERLLDDMNDAGAAVAVGGMASGGRGAGEHVLFCGEEIHREGAVVVDLEGPVQLRTLVSQGCAPIGPEMVVTQAESNVIHELAGRPAYGRLVEIVGSLDLEQAELARRGVLAGLVIDENRVEYGADDYLVRGILGGDPESGAIAVGDVPRVGQTFRFHVRDASTADAGLRAALAAGTALPGRVTGGLLFACNGRGMGLFGTPDHDAAATAAALGGAPVAGMFCAGEIGPVGGRTFLHGFTATLALFVEE